MGPLDLDQSQRFVAEMLFNDYAAAISDLAEAVDAEADQAGRERMADVFAGRARMDPEQLARSGSRCSRCTGAIGKGRTPCSKNCSVHSEAFSTRLSSSSWSSPWSTCGGSSSCGHGEAQERSPEYAGDGVDVIELMEAAKAEELAGVRPEALAPVAAAYAAEMNALLLECAVADRAGVMAQRIARIRGDESARRDAERQAILRWQRFDELNRRTVARVGELAASAGGEAARRRWRERFRRAAFPWMYRDQQVERCLDWITKQDVAGEVIQAAMRIDQEYQTRRSRLVEDAITAMIQGRLQQKRIIHPLTGMSELNDSASRELYERLLKNSGERSALEAAAVAELEALLSGDQRRELRRIAR